MTDQQTIIAMAEWIIRRLRWIAANAELREAKRQKRRETAPAKREADQQ